MNNNHKLPTCSIIAFLTLLFIGLTGCEDVVTDPIQNQEATVFGIEPGIMNLTR